MCQMGPASTSLLVHRFWPGVSLGHLGLGWQSGLLGPPRPVTPTCLNGHVLGAGGDDQSD